MITERQIPLLAGIQEESKKALFAKGKMMQYKKHQQVYQEHEKVDCIYFLIEGVAIACKQAYGDERRVILIHRQGELMNEEILDGHKCSSTCECITPATLFAIPVAEFIEIYKHDQMLMENVMKHMSLRIRRLYHMSKNAINSLRGDKKLAARLWKLAQDYGENTSEGREITFPISITLMAEMMGSKRETVSRQIKVLQEEGYLIIRTKRVIVLNMDNLLAYVQKP